MHRFLWIIIAGVIFGLCSSQPVYAQALSNIFSFEQSNGKDPRGGLIAGSDGYFYGTTFEGGAGNAGTVFRLDPQTSELVTLAHFSGANGRGPAAPLVEGGDGYFYGTTTAGGQHNLGTVFRITPGGELATVAHFNVGDGNKPGTLILATDGDLYGVTFGDFGTVFRVTPENQIVTLVRFDGSNGEHPETLRQGSLDGYFYGTTRRGGSEGYGTVFRTDASGELTLLASFDESNGRTPHGELVEDDRGDFYGTTIYGGSFRRGTVFRIDGARAVMSVAEFSGSTGRYPAAGLIFRGSDRSFFGTTSDGGTGSGTFFRLGDGGQIATLATFSPSVGSSPSGGLVQDGEGNFYGTTRFGGAGGHGAVFKFSMPVQRLAPVITSSLHLSGKVGTQFEYQIAADNEPAGFDLIGDLPEGLVWDEEIGTISGVPLIAGTFPVSVTAFNTAGFDQADLEIIIAPDSVTRLKLLPARRKVTAGRKVKMTLLVSNNSLEAEPVTVRLRWDGNTIAELPMLPEFEAKPKKRPRHKAKATRLKFEFILSEAAPAGQTILIAEVVGLTDSAAGRASSTFTVRPRNKR